MDLRKLLELLTDPESYPHPCDTIQVHHTHISVVFLAGPYAYKIKKPLDLGFLNFTTLQRRHHYCLEEVRLNRRLAPRVYLGVLPVAVHRGTVRVDGEGEVAEWAVWMERLPEAATLKERLARGELVPEDLDAVARRVAAFHARAEAGDHVAEGGRWAVVARNALENFEQSARHVGTTVSPRVFERFRELTQAALEDLRPLIEERARRGVPRDTHGDLHLDHVYVFPDRSPPDDLVIVDCIEFNERFRYADPVADAAFLAMDLACQGRRDLARRFSEAYLAESGDEEGRELLPLYIAYRAAVRAKVEGFEAYEPEVPEAERREALASARAHWLLGLGQLEDPPRRPALVCVGGLPGTGKSTLAEGLGRQSGFSVISTDRIRKELAGVGAQARAAAPFGEGIYTPEWNDRTYAECLRRAEEALFRGERVLVDGSFREEARRKRFLDAARRWAVPGLFLLCHTDPDRVRDRLAGRTGGPSDADWKVYRKAAALWEEPGSGTLEAFHEIPTGGGVESALEAAIEVLRVEGLA